MFDVNAVSDRLQTLGYECSGSDTAALTFCVYKVSNTIKNDVNQSVVPEGLEKTAVDMAVGEFLLMKKTFSPNELTGIDLDYAVKQIQTGDTNVSFAVGGGNQTPEQRLDAFIGYLLNNGRSEFSAYRRLRW